MNPVFRLAQRSDLTVINRIYNQAIIHRHQTADLDEISVSGTEDWYDQHDILKYPIFVVEVEGKTIGWSSLSAYRKGRQALEEVSELSYYLDQSFLGKGLGKFLMEKTIAESKNYGFRTLVAILLDSNIPSKSILEKFGFKEWGRIPEAANIDGERKDHLYYGLTL